MPEPSTEPELSPEIDAAIAELEKQLAEAQSQAAEYKDGWQRSVADFQNYRRRVDAEKNETYQNAVGSVIKRYLPILDDLERALATRPADLAWVDGIELIYRKLQSILEAEGLKRIEAEGQMFDPNFHEAIIAGILRWIRKRAGDLRRTEWLYPGGPGHPSGTGKSGAVIFKDCISSVRTECLLKTRDNIFLEKS